ncbi:S66 peptidase family protein [Gelidibacter salicanalis]|uniref:LD-carboxypeptidase n=1 Tax=Gelidibacter salicanalis TaxID=291193 RepID=A0A934KQQ2_9FLAO|nr:LD-carboxypeptidase [Gelidibacter salicanalis]MBJ7882079.1 LD-carboxypeptidase [Gelidibacter salicanalis]
MSKITFTVVITCLFVLLGAQEFSAQEKSSIIKQHTLVRPPYLKVGDTVAIVAPSGILKNRTAEIKRAQDLLSSWGLHTVLGTHLFADGNHFAGTDAERCADFQEAMDDPTISAIWAARGGYGTIRIIDKLDYTKFRKNPKWVIGYSDITALHSQLNVEGFESMHAMMAVSVTENLEDIKETVQTLKDALFGKPLAYSLESSTYNKIGTVTGPLVGGNLSLLYSMLGSKTSIDISGSILFIEEVGEYAYSVDRMLQSLKRAGYFDNCKGVIVGDFSKVRKNTTPWGTSMEQLILDALSEYNFPIAFKMPAGHEDDNRALIFGRTVELSVGKEASTVKFKN